MTVANGDDDHHVVINAEVKGGMPPLRRTLRATRPIAQI
jgi:hypothetical protein